MSYSTPTSITNLFAIEKPIIQAGMIWASGWRLAAAVSNAGALGTIGSGSMYPEVLEEHLKKCKKATTKPFAVNIPLLYRGIEEHIKTVIKYKVPIVFTSAGNPKLYTSILQSEGIKVVHVVSSKKFALKAEDAGVDAVVAEGFEAGGHNGREETTSFILIPLIKNALKIPVIAAGGIATGIQMAAALVLGADAVQVGSRFVTSNEASSHANFKNEILAAGEGDTILTMKQLNPVRLLKNEFYRQVQRAEEKCTSTEDLIQLLGRARAKLGMYEGNLIDGELEIGQVSALINSIKPATEIVTEIWEEYAGIFPLNR